MTLGIYFEPRCGFALFQSNRVAVLTPPTQQNYSLCNMNWCGKIKNNSLSDSGQLIASIVLTHSIFKFLLQKESPWSFARLNSPILHQQTFRKRFYFDVWYVNFWLPQASNPVFQSLNMFFKVQRECKINDRKTGKISAKWFAELIAEKGVKISDQIVRNHSPTDFAIWFFRVIFCRTMKKIQIEFTKSVTWWNGGKNPRLWYGN